MSDATSTTDEAVAEAAPATIENVDLLTFADETRIGIPEDEYRSFLGSWQALVKAAARETNRFTNAVKALAEKRAQGRAFVIRADGFPDWSGASDAWKRSVSVVEAPILGTLDRDAKTRLDNAVRQHVKRTYLLHTVVGYIVQHEPNFEAEAATFASDPAAVLSNPSSALKGRVQAHYKAAKLDLPNGPFQKAGKATGGGPDDGDKPTSPLDTLTEALGGLGDITPRHSVLGILKAVSEISQKLEDGKINEIEARPFVVATLRRLAVIGTETAAMIEGGKYDEAALKAARFDSKADKLDS